MCSYAEFETSESCIICAHLKADKQTNVSSMHCQSFAIYQGYGN